MPESGSTPMLLAARRGRIASMSANALSVAKPVRRRPAVAVRPAPPSRRARYDLEPVAAQWQRALDSGERALHAAAESLPPAYLAPRRRALVEERRRTSDLLVEVARAAGATALPWLSPLPITNRMLGVDDSVRACLFDLDGVLTDSNRLHADAWGTVLDELLLRLSGETGWHFIPFDRRADYRTYIEGRSRLEGVHAFLQSRGIRLPEGHADDLPDAHTAWGLARRKGDTLMRIVEHEGVTPLLGVRRYLEAAARAGLRRAVISASANTRPMLELARLAQLFEVRVDAEVIRSEGARTPPSPDLLLAACGRLDVPPELAAMYTHRPAGIAAARAAGMHVIGVGVGPEEEVLRGFGAELVVPSLEALLDRALLSDERRRPV